jgi:hypothetical protein
MVMLSITIDKVGYKMFGWQTLPSRGGLTTAAYTTGREYTINTKAIRRDLGSTSLIGRKQAIEQCKTWGQEQKKSQEDNPGENNGIMPLRIYPILCRSSSG